MNLKKVVVSLAVQFLAERTNIVRKSDPLETLMSNLFDIETEEQRLARQIESGLDEVTRTAKRVKTNREFKKIVRSLLDFKGKP